MKDKVVLLSGANGFIGRNLAGMLMEQGAKVAALPREILGNITALQEIAETINPDYIVHLAAYGNHSSQTTEIDEIFATNVIKTYNLLRATSNIDYKGFINVSTSSVYGMRDEEMKEDMKPEPTTFYACTKTAAENLTRMFATQLNKPVVTVRPFSIYGPGEAPNRFIPKAINCMLTEDMFTLAQHPMHDWTYIEDFVNGVITVLNVAKELQGQEVNIGTGIQLSNKQVIEMLEEVTGKEINIVLDDQISKEWDTEASWVADIERLKKYGWKPKFGLKKGLKDTFEYYKKVHEDTEKANFDPIAQSLKDIGVEFEDPEDVIGQVKSSDNIILPDDQ